MTPDGCRGSFHVPGSPTGDLAWGHKKEAGKIRPNTVIISQTPFQVNAQMVLRGQNLCSPQKRMSAFRKHSVLKSWKFRVIL